MSIEEWKVGADAVIRDCDHYAKAKVSRLTATQIVVKWLGPATEYERKFSRSSGLEVGNHAGSRCMIMRPSESSDLYFARREAVDRTKAASNKALSFLGRASADQAAKVAEIMREALWQVTQIADQVE